MINNIRSDTVMDALTEGFYKGIKRYMKDENGQNKFKSAYYAQYSCCSKIKH